MWKGDNMASPSKETMHKLILQNQKDLNIEILDIDYETCTFKCLVCNALRTNSLITVYNTFKRKEYFHSNACSKYYRDIIRQELGKEATKKFINMYHTDTYRYTVPSNKRYNTYKDKFKFDDFPSYFNNCYNAYKAFIKQYGLSDLGVGRVENTKGYEPEHISSVPMNVKVENKGIIEPNKESMYNHIIQKQRDLNIEIIDIDYETCTFKCLICNAIKTNSLITIYKNIKNQNYLHSTTCSKYYNDIIRQELGEESTKKFANMYEHALQRCTNPSKKEYLRDKDKFKFNDFPDYFNNCYTDFKDGVRQYGLGNLSLVRIDSTKGYEPGNIRFVPLNISLKNRGMFESNKELMYDPILRKQKDLNIEIIDMDYDTCTYKCLICNAIRTNSVNTMYSNINNQNYFHSIACSEYYNNVVKKELGEEAAKIFYIKYRGALQRCTTPNAVGYKYYKGRFKFDDFPDYFNNCYTSFKEGVKQYGLDNISIDRIDGNKGYEQGNIRFVPMSVNLANMPNVRPVAAYNEVTKQLLEAPNLNRLGKSYFNGKGPSLYYPLKTGQLYLDTWHIFYTDESNGLLERYKEQQAPSNHEK